MLHVSCDLGMNPANQSRRGHNRLSTRLCLSPRVRVQLVIVV